MATLGVDYAWDRPDPHCLYSAGYRFACRYLSYDTEGKNITSPEVLSLHLAGLGVVLNWEWGKYDARQGADLGGRQGRDAGAFATHVGAPKDQPIYFSVDFDAQPHEYAAIGAYFHSVNTVLGAARVGVYGGIRIVDYLYTHKLARWFWQTYAWSGTSIHPQAHLYQYSNGHTICGARLDLDRAIKPAFGQWGGAPTGLITAATPALPVPSNSSFDYTGDIAATSGQIGRLGATLDTYTSLIDGLRSN